MANLAPTISSSSTDECSITSESMVKLASKGKLVKTSCDHMFDNDAIVAWIKKKEGEKEKCPICRGDTGTLTPVTVVIEGVAKGRLADSSSSSSGSSGVKKRRLTLADINGSCKEDEALKRALEISVSDTHYDGEEALNAAIKSSMGESDEAIGFQGAAKKSKIVASPAIVVPVVEPEAISSSSLSSYTSPYSSSSSSLLSSSSSSSLLPYTSPFSSSSSSSSISPYTSSHSSSSSSLLSSSSASSLPSYTSSYSSSSPSSLSGSSSSSVQNAPSSSAVNELSKCIDEYLLSLKDFSDQLVKCQKNSSDNIMVYAALGRTYVEKFSEKIEKTKTHANSQLNSEPFRKHLLADTEHFQRKMRELKGRCETETPENRRVLQAHIDTILANIGKIAILFKMT